jgi:uncharacterized membrane protein YbhN (UPF0104 family)
MTNKSLQENFTELNDVIKRYINTKINYWKVVLLEKIYKIWGHLFLFLLVIVSLLFVFLLLAFAFSYWYGNNIGTISTGFLIAAGGFVIIALLLYLLRKPLFSNKIIEKISTVLFDDDDNEK